MEPQESFAGHREHSGVWVRAWGRGAAGEAGAISAAVRLRVAPGLQALTRLRGKGKGSSTVSRRDPALPCRDTESGPSILEQWSSAFSKPFLA